jgi:Mg2+-importing ATPase
LVLPFLPFASALGFTRLPPAFFAMVAVIVASYVISAEVAKHFFYRAPVAARA